MRPSPSARRPAIAPDRFRRFAAIDWSGARGDRLPGIAVALCEAGGTAPSLVPAPRGRWSRQDVLGWIAAEAPAGDLLIGLDLGMAFAHADHGAFFPHWNDTPADAPSLWALVERLCQDDAHLGADGLVDHVDASRHFRRPGGRAGDLFPPGAGRMRVTELESRRQRLANPVSNFNLVGAAQVGKSSLTGMRVLHRLSGSVTIWPFDPLPDRGTVLVEIYTSIAALAAGLPRGRTKVRDPQTLDRALAALGSEPHTPLERYTDHMTDALVTAAWLRQVHADPALWKPSALTATIAATEGWTFGVP